MSTTRATPSGIMWGRILLAAGAVVGLAVVATVFAAPQLRDRFRSRPPVDEKGAAGKDKDKGGFDAEAVALMRTQLQGWGVPSTGKDAETDDAVVTRYFDTLTYRAKPGAAVHPDEVFAARFANTPPRPAGPAQLDDALAKTLGGLGGEASKGAKAKDLVAAVGEAARFGPWFDAWVAKEPLRARAVGKQFVFPTDAPADKDAARFAEKFSNDGVAPGEVKNGAKAAAQQLNRWMVRGVTADDAARRPAYVLRVYTHFLSRHHIPPAVLDHKDWNAGFMKRLPAAPVGGGKNLGTEAAARNALQDLGKEIGSAEAESARFLTSIIGAVGESLDYPRWYAENRPRMAFEANPAGLAPEVVLFVERFKPQEP